MHKRDMKWYLSQLARASNTLELQDAAAAVADAAAHDDALLRETVRIELAASCRGL